MAAAKLGLASEVVVKERSKALGEPSWLLDDRLRALVRYAELPLESSPLFTRHTEQPKGIEDLAPSDAKPLLQGPEVGRFEELGQAVRRAEPLREALTADFGGFPHDQLTNLPRAMFGTGAVLLVPKDRHAEEPFTIRYEASPGAVFARNVLVLEPGARATVVEEVTGDRKGLLAMTTEVHLGQGAELRLLGVETTGEGHVTVASRQALVGQDARLEMHHAYTGAALVKGRSDVALDGRGARVRQSEVVFGAKQQRYDLTSNIVHRGEDTVSDALSKAVLRDRSRANIKGVITLLQEGKNSDSFLGQHAMLLSKEARCIAIPSLEIVNREIKRAKHAATVAQVDEAQIFYLQTRGLSERDARRTIVLGFLGPLLEQLGEERAERVRQRIEATWE